MVITFNTVLNGGQQTKSVQLCNDACESLLIQLYSLLCQEHAFNCGLIARIESSQISVLIGKRGQDESDRAIC